MVTIGPSGTGENCPATVFLRPGLVAGQQRDLGADPVPAGPPPPLARDCAGLHVPRHSRVDIAYRHAVRRQPDEGVSGALIVRREFQRPAVEFSRRRTYLTEMARTRGQCQRCPATAHGLKVDRESLGLRVLSARTQLDG